MKSIAEQFFFGAIIELVSLLLSYIFKDKPRNAIAIFAIGTLIAGLVAFNPFFSSILAPDLPIVATSTPAIKATITPVSVETLVFNEDFEDGIADNFQILTGNWNVIDDGTSTKVLESKNSDKTNWAHIEFGPEELSNFIIEYQVNLKDFDITTNYGGKTSLQFWAKYWSDSNYALDIQPEFGTFTLDYNGKFPNGEWGELGQIFLVFEKDVWYSIQLKFLNGEMTVYLNGRKVITAKDTRLSPAGRLAFNIDPESHVQFDNIKIWEIE